MAEMIRNQHHLVALHLNYVPARSGAKVVFTVWHGSEKLVQTELPAAQIGIQPHLNVRTYRDIHFVLPEKELDACVSAASDRAADADDPIWLQVAQSTGYLAAVPWERFLFPAFDRPLLRIPNFLVDPTFVRGRPELVICASSPRAKSAFSVPYYTEQLLEAVFKALPGGARFHVFADLDAFNDLQERLQKPAGQFAVIVYDPRDAASFGEGSTNRSVRGSARQGELSSPWMLWVQDALRGRRVNGMHFICPGYFSRDRGALALASSPLKNMDQEWSHMVGIDEVTALLNMLGASTVAFSPPHENVWSIGLRLLADQLAWRRPGALLLHDTSRGDTEQLSQAYRFLFGSEPSEPPRSRSIMLYCHPKRLRRFADTDSGSRFVAGAPDRREYDVDLAVTKLHELLGQTQRSGGPAQRSGPAEQSEPAWEASNRVLLDSILSRLGNQSQARIEATVDILKMHADLFGVSAGGEEGSP